MNPHRTPFCTPSTRTTTQPPRPSTVYVQTPCLPWSNSTALLPPLPQPSEHVIPADLSVQCDPAHLSYLHPQNNPFPFSLSLVAMTPARLVRDTSDYSPASVP
ncbi:hypothetical protein SODALDRAFT_118863 [Sodiomyces alkalinus F11]|uniref:Uncharacterized protein n=1 Tax=Sodiomyces alkalinus (strain CBS 110278 / VKM F-3762 / F11) TaxID=1314773 RepID=A0A3N2Q3R7_SODAK|nr:hypothetical protein SODALDRAFT_118863 [Sodiomyces alkalinus F11]ROT41411.1 hypothetical protein SODALDRAFT_118863 [Sodiomyces alkalinus F11]